MMDKYNSIFVDGIDRCGKNTLVKYIHNMSKHRYMAYDRGIFSNIAYSMMYNRGIQYNLKSYKPFVFVYLTCDEEDWKIRCKLTNEPLIDYAQHRKVFDDVHQMFIDNKMKIVEFNTSQLTPYQIAKQVIDYVDKLNENANVVDEELDWW